MSTIDPTTFFEGPILVTVPHMDDAVLGCGGLLLQIPDKRRIHLVYSSDGRGMFREAGLRLAPRLSGDINAIRKAEVAAALEIVGIPPGNATFLDFPDWRLRAHRRELAARLQAIVANLRPRWILTPFRFDKHPDHVALNRTVRALDLPGDAPPTLLEYFVYYQWKMLPRGDIRAYLREDNVLRVELGPDVGAAKRRALDCFTSQITRLHPAQHRPVLSDALLSDFAAGPEYLLRARPGLTERAVFTLPPALVHVVHRVEPVAKWVKEWTRFAWHNLCRLARSKT